MGASSATTGRLRRGWEFYRRYTKRRTGVHAGATAALTVFGLLAYYNRWFVVVAIVAYLVPPVYLYLTGDDLADPDRPVESRDAAGTTTPDRTTSEPADADADTDSDSDADTDTDSDDGDSDADSDSDSDDGDSDTDSDG